MTIAERVASERLDWIVPAWDAPSNVHGVFTTRNAGSDASFDLGPADVQALAREARSRIAANRALLGRVLPGQPVWLEQTHGRNVATIDASTLDTVRARPPVADAAVTRLPNVPLAIRVADCLPVFLTDDAGTLVAAAHAGWRGLAAGVLEAAVSAMAADVRSLRAWLGPAIGPTAFEVGEDVVDAFARDDRDALHWFAPLRDGKWLADLAGLARRRLQACGIDRVYGGGEHCTWNDATRFFSWRRDRTPHRMAAVVWRTGSPG